MKKWMAWLLAAALLALPVSAGADAYLGEEALISEETPGAQAEAVDEEAREQPAEDGNSIPVNSWMEEVPEEIEVIIGEDTPDPQPEAGAASEEEPVDAEPIAASDAALGEGMVDAALIQEDMAVMGATDAGAPLTSAFSPAVASGDLGDNLSWLLNEDGVLTIGGLGPMCDADWYESGRMPWDEYKSARLNLETTGIQSVVILEGVTTIGANAFNGCEYLRTVRIPESVTEIGEHAFFCCFFLDDVTLPGRMTRIGAGAFSACYSLTSIEIPGSVTSVGESAFDFCNHLESVTIQEGLTYIDAYTFYYCTGLKSVSIPASVTGIGYCAFHTCTSLESVTIPGSVTSIDDVAFSGCESLTSVTIPGSVTSIGGGAFGSCEGLTSVTISEGVAKIGNYAFSGCTSLESVTIPGSVSDTGCDAFANCTGLTRVTVCEGVPGIGTGMFAGCSGLTRVTPAGGVALAGDVTLPGSVTYIGGGAFGSCEGLTSVTLPASVTEIGSQAFRYCSNLASVTLPESVTSIGDGAFAGCVRLPSINLPGGLGGIDSFVFQDCVSLTSMTIPEGVTGIGYGAFEGCSGLTHIELPDTLEHIEDYAFAGCSGLTDVAIPEGVTALDSYAFSGCAGLTHITLPWSMIDIGDFAFKDCTALKDLTIRVNVARIFESVCEGCDALTDVYFDGTVAAAEAIEISENNDVLSAATWHYSDAIGGGKCGDNLMWVLNEAGALTVSGTGPMYDYHPWMGPAPWSSKTEAIRSAVLPAGMTRIGDYAFRDCDNLRTVTIPGSVTEIGENAFDYCASLESVTIPAGVTSISASAFGGCVNLTSVVIPAGVTSIERDAFCGCSGLTSVTIPDSVTFIGDYAFLGCDALTDVYFGGTAAAAAAIEMGENNNTLRAATWHYSDAVDNAVIRSATASFEGKIGLNFYLLLPEAVLNDGGAYVRFTGGEAEKDVAVSAATRREVNGEMRYCFTYYVVANEIRDNINLKVYDGNGNVVPLKNHTGTNDYTQTGVNYSLLTYLDGRIANSTDPGMVALAKATKDYGTAAQIYFGYKAEGLSVSEAVTSVTSAELEPYKAIFEGSLPAGVTRRSITALFESDNSFRLYYSYASGVDPTRYSYSIDGREKTPQVKGAQRYLEVNNVASDELDTVHVYKITDGESTYKVTCSVLTYARSSVLNGTEARQNLGKALYRYNQAANTYFGN